MTPQQYKQTWEETGDSLVQFPADAFIGTNVAADTQQFLSIAGLPKEAAPFLTFESPKSGPLTTVAKLWRLGPKFNEYLVIGSNGSGDPVVLSSIGAVLYLNHDAGFTECYINKNIRTLCESMLRCREVISETQRIVGYDGYLDGHVPEQLKESFVHFLKHSDSRALESGSMWAEEVASWIA